MARAAPKRKTSAKKAARKSAAPEAVKKAAAKKAAPAKAAVKKAAPKKTAAKGPAKRPVGRPPGKKAAAAPAKRPVGRPPAKKAAAVKAPMKRSVGRPPGKKAAAAPGKRPVGRPPSKNAAVAALAKRPMGRRPGLKPVVVKVVAKRGRMAAPAPRLAARAAVQSFSVCHLNENDFKTDGLRPYAQYRDLGIAAATGGLCQAHVIRLVPPCTDEVRKRHLHETELQLIYVLKGWIKNEFEGHGEQMMSAGSCWLQPPGIEHTVLDYSADCEVLEIIVPADFKTVDLA